MIERLWGALEKKLFPERNLRTKENKEIIRMDFSARRRSLSTDKVHALSEKIMSKIEQSREFINARTILIYHPIHNEVDTRILLEKWHDKKQFLLPVVKSGNKMELHYYVDENNLKTGKFGIQEPDSKCFKGKPDLIILPGVAFDRQRNRLGRGRGFYDRLLQRARHVPTIGVAYDFQLVSVLPTSIMDKKVSFVYTPSQIIR